MQINQLKRNTERKLSKYVGRGGKRGKTSGRGTKGQNARAGRKKYPEIRDFIKRIPKLRGHGKNSNPSIQEDDVVLNLKDIQTMSGIISPEILVKAGKINKVAGKTPKVKILGMGDAPKGVEIVGCEVSKSAREAIEKAGGTIK